MAWRQASIVGVGATRQGKLPDETPLSLAAQAFRLALEDGGIDKREVDGLLTMPGTTSPEGAKNYLNVGELVGVNPRFTGSLTMGGATGGALIQIAAMAIATGMAKTVACIFADTARTGGSRFAARGRRRRFLGRVGHVRQCRQQRHGLSPPHGALRLSPEHLGWIAVTCRKHAAMNPNAVMRDPITLDDHQNSRLIVDPLRLLDCCLISDGAVCVIVTSPERAQDCRKRPVAIWGMGQGHTTENLRLREWWYLPHQRDCVADAYRMAGVSPKDISLAQLYDNFTVAVLFWLEHAGFCPEGRPAPSSKAARASRSAVRCRSTTAGGNLSESYMQGWLHIVEGVRQLRGECGQRQVGDAELCLVTGRGMTLNTASCLILGH